MLKKSITWNWTHLEQQAFELAKEVLSSAPVMAYPMDSQPYRIYSDACDYGLAAILQQIQPMVIKDLKGTKAHDKLLRAFESGEPVPVLAPRFTKREDMTEGASWEDNWAEILGARGARAGGELRTWA